MSPFLMEDMEGYNLKSITIMTMLALSNWAMSATTYECSYLSYSDAKGNHKQNFSLIFLLDKNTKKTYLMGNNGSTEVIYIDKGIGQSFVEITESGNIMTTTIDQNMKSVHSRNSVTLTGELLPSQYYGSCKEK